jgi:ElaB/YqjD/DUF883 family membrane-anchored ribosome-binding protein
MDTENGFKTMSQHADADAPGKTPAPGSSRLKQFDDDDELSDAGRARATELQRLIIEEIRDRPVRALGWAATAGFILGIWVSR